MHGCSHFASVSLSYLLANIRMVVGAGGWEFFFSQVDTFPGQKTSKLSSSMSQLAKKSYRALLHSKPQLPLAPESEVNPVR